MVDGSTAWSSVPWSASMLKSTIDKESAKTSKQKSDSFLDIADTHFQTLQKQGSTKRGIKFSPKKVKFQPRMDPPPQIQIINMDSSAGDESSKSKSDSLPDNVEFKNKDTAVQPPASLQISKPAQVIFCLQVSVLIVLCIAMGLSYLSLSTRISTLEEGLLGIPSELSPELLNKLSFIEYMVNQISFPHTSDTFPINIKSPINQNPQQP